MGRTRKVGARSGGVRSVALLVVAVLVLLLVVVSWGAVAAGGRGGAQGRVAHDARRRTVPGYWVADRAGGALVRVDDGFAERLRVSLPSPTRVATGSEGDLVWAASAVDGWALGAYRVVALDSDGAERATFDAHAVVDLDAGAAAAAWVEWEVPAHGGITSSVHWATAAGARRRFDVDDATSVVVAPGDRGVLVGTRDGRLEVWSTEHPPLRVAEVALGGELVDVARGPAGGWLVLDVVGRRLLTLAGDLSIAGSLDLGLSAQSLAVDVARQKVWVVDTTEPVVRRYDAKGALELHVADLPLGGFDRAAPTREGGLVLTAPGFLLELGAGGSVLQTQGGFGFLTDVARIP